jgi:hypothetical protein
VPGLPSLELLAETVESELAAQERRGDALDSKAGVLLGFAGVLVGLTVSNLDGTLATIGAACAGGAAVLAGLAFIPRSFPTLKLRPLRRRYLTADEEFTRLRLLDTRIAMQQRDAPAPTGQGVPRHRRLGGPRRRCGLDRPGRYAWRL